MGKVGVLFSVFLVLKAIEAFWPKRVSPLKGKEARLRMARNLGLGVIHRGVATPLILAPVLAIVSHFSLQPLQGVPQGLRFLIGFLAYDLVQYFTHWLGHRVPLLWRFHSVHHLDNHLDATTGFRVHFFEKILFLPFRALVVFGLGIPIAHLALFELITFVNGIFHHSNLRLPIRLEEKLAWVLTSPAFHGVHHHALLPETDSNYGFVFTFWDRLFGTVSEGWARKQAVPGVNERKNGEHPECFAELLLDPFHQDLEGTRGEYALS